MIPNNFAETIQFMTEEEEAIEESEAEQIKIAKRKKRMADCGRWSIKINPENGLPKRLYYKCEVIDCPQCLAERAVYYHKRILAGFMDGKPLNKRSVPEDEQKHFARDFKRSEYLRFPQRDGSYLFVFVDETGEHGGSPIEDGEALARMDWQEIVRTPKGKNISGGLNAPPPEPKEDIAYVMNESVVCTDLEPKEMDTAAEQAWEETKKLDPKTPAEVEKAIKTRVKAFKKAIKQRGGTPRSYHFREKVHISRIQWRVYGKCHVDVDHSWGGGYKY